MDKAAVLGVARHVITTLGGGLAASVGLATTEWETAVGAVMVLAGIAWSVIEKARR